MEELAGDFTGDLMGGIMSSIWPHAAKYIQSELLGCITSSISGSFDFSSFMNFFRFTESSMGSAVPKITNPRIIEIGKDNIALEVDVDYDGDATFAIEVGTAMANLSFGVKNLTFKGPMQIEFKDLTSTVPFISAIVCYFTEAPDVDFKLTKSAAIANQPFIHKNVKKALKDAIATQLLEPERMVIPLEMANKDPSVYKFPLPARIVAVNVLEAADLPDLDSTPGQGASDPFVKVYLDPRNQARTPVIKNELNPTWDFKTVFSVFRKNAQLLLEVIDSDDFEKLVPEIVEQLPTEQIESLPFGLGKKINKGFGGFMGSSFGFLNKKVEEIKEKTDLIPDILKKPLEDKLQEYSEEPLGKVKINLKKLWNKGVTDEWFDLKAPEGGRIHCLIDLKKPVSVEELEEGKEKKKVFQFYLRDLCGIPTDTAGYESGEEVYLAILELENGKVAEPSLELGRGKIDPENNFGFVHFDRAEFMICEDADEEISGEFVVKIIQEDGNDGTEICRAKIAIADEQKISFSHRNKIDGEISIHGRAQVQYYQ
ncbi:Oidioi.mRNA.OKI2018_I69.chr2.g6076.t1.cds [Oikopleura dioica]|uniref:Oidioi.mRNA.OKI2018_I69.chr2.g6076.t1.cds n=1 Tax=Oikopleura dioica TaxID=34765 RepID=A0ABN7TBB4_OIKDI|nr:Oidioi.mRNA.OKI2018_I69.chr2.g6076.t1.cds [Oikopleura dioica]